MVKYMAVAVAVAVAVSGAVPVAGLTKRFLNQCLGLPAKSHETKNSRKIKNLTVCTHWQ